MNMKKKIILILLAIIVIITVLLVSCQPKICPAYASNNTESVTKI